MHHLLRNTNIIKWGKLLWPRKWLKYYPPVFVLRNPIIASVYSSIKKDNQVVIYVFKIFNDHFEEKTADLSKQNLKMIFKNVVKETIADNEIIALHDYFNNSFVLFHKVDHNKNTVFEAETLMNQIQVNIMNTVLHMHSIQLSIEAGYMFVEKNCNDIEQAVFMAYQQAIAMAEKKATSDYNEMLYQITKIIANKEIDLLGQPIIDMTTNKVKAMEILTRGPRGTPYEQPLQLFSVARQTNLLFQLELIVLEKAFQQIVETNCQHLMFINFTPITIGNVEFVNKVKRMLFKYNEISPYNIIFEITEGDSIENIEHFQQNIKVIRSLGIRVAIDDTGSGYACLQMISEILPDIIKIDRSVIKDIDQNNVKETMLKGLLLIAKEIGSVVVAEGIEKQEEASVLTRNKVDMAQGYFYAKPASMIT